jgi:iron complex outermembrane receptor protein
LVLNSSSKNRIEFGATAGYTIAYIDQTTKYNIENNQVVSTSIIKNDPLPEIPAMSTSAWIIYKIASLNLVPRLNIEYTLPQNSISTANYEESTPDYFIINTSIRYSYKKWATLNFGVNNLLNLAYYNHLNRRVVSSNPAEKIKLFEPGRVFFVNLKLDF